MWGLECCTVHYPFSHLLFNHGYDSLAGSNEGISTGDIRKITQVVLKAMRIFSGYYSNTLSQGVPPAWQNQKSDQPQSGRRRATTKSELFRFCPLMVSSWEDPSQYQHYNPVLLVSCQLICSLKASVTWIIFNGEWLNCLMSFSFPVASRMTAPRRSSPCT